MANIKDVMAAVDSLERRIDAEFNEADHPRDEDGKFGSGGGYKKKEGEQSRETFARHPHSLEHKGKTLYKGGMMRDPETGEKFTSYAPPDLAPGKPGSGKRSAVSKKRKLYPRISHETGEISEYDPLG